MSATNIKFKQTGIGWMPEVPEHWQMWKVSRAFKTIGSGTTPESGNNSFYENGTINWINTGDLNDGVLDSCDKKVTQKAFDEHSTLKIYKKGTLLIAMYGATIGKVSLLNINGCTNQACCALSESEVLRNEFAFYWFLCNKPNIVRLSYGGGQPNISQDVIKQLRIPTPPLSEQDEIVQYIKAQEEKINLFIQKKQRFIELLKEQRQSKIDEAVDGTYKNWLNKKLKYVAEIKFSNVDKHTIEDEIPVRLCNYVDVYKNDYITNDLEFMNATATETEIEKFTVLKGDVIITKDSEEATDIAVPTFVIEDLENVICGYHLALIRANENEILNEYLFRKFQSSELKAYFAIEATGVTRVGLSMGEITGVKISYPKSIEEQKQIVSHIKTETATIDKAINKAEREIELIREYKEAMIAEAVMGKKNSNFAK